MRRSDHSMLPPAPAATIAYGSPNACNICHADRDAAWADRWVRRWRKRNYQAPILHRASLIEAARKRDWRKLPAMLEYINSREHDAIFAASLIRLLRPCVDERKWPVLIQAMKDPSPLVRANAAESLGDWIGPEALITLAGALRDESRLVRIRAASAMAAVPPQWLDAATADAFNKAAEEFKRMLDARPDHWASHYNMGNFYSARRDYARAVTFYETAIRLQPRVLMPYVNVSFAYNALGMNDKAEQSLRKACELFPKSLEAHLNLGLLLGEMRRLQEAEKYLKKAVELDPGSAVAAYNLGMVNAQLQCMDSAIDYLQRAYKLEPENRQYGYSLAFYLEQKGDISASVRILQQISDRRQSDIDAVLLLGEIYRKQGKVNQARKLYQHELARGELSAEERELLKGRLAELEK